MGKVIFVVLDGLRFDVARASMGYLAHLIEIGQAALYRVKAELPTLSRPLYEVLLTGTPASVNGITANEIRRSSHQRSVFHLVTQQSGTTAAAAYHWFSELYNRSPFDPLIDREQHDPASPIQHGKFYFEDAYPDSHLFADAEMLRREWAPNFMLVHPMGLDYAGHCYGSESSQYEAQAIATDSLLAQYLPHWIQSGYSILITADHGMNAHGLHGGNAAELRETPLFCLGDFLRFKPPHEAVSQLAIAPLLCTVLAIPMSDYMMSHSSLWVE
jgi:predicted AlkP superfamily pyrophosphatase or phosphodiesterase